ncbi:MAG: PAS domain S-box protein, partial [Candidatus Electrothrix sp. AR5]|nr:PAS domain S-box protein [Candidatus Electrothrix sp. AR5]
DDCRGQIQRLDREVLRLEEELGEVRQELRLAVEVFAGSVEGTIITDADFRVLRVNPAFTRITEYQPDEVVGRRLPWLKDEDFAQEVLISLDEQDHWRGEHRDITKSGADYVSWLNISSVKNVQGQVTDYIAAFLDITEEKCREEENDRYLEELNAAYRRFVPQRFLEYLEKPSIIDIELGNHVERSMTVLFSDIIDFTKLSESMSPTENFRFINSYLSIMEPIITRHNGFIDKYIGDAVMGERIEFFTDIRQNEQLHPEGRESTSLCFLIEDAGNGILARRFIRVSFSMTAATKQPVTLYHIILLLFQLEEI